MANELTTVRRLIADDAHALTFQTFGQYRTALLKAIDALPPVAGEAVAGAIDARGQELAEAKALADSEGSRAVKYLRIIRKVRAVVDEWPEVDILGSPLSRIRTIVAFAGAAPASADAGAGALIINGEPATAQSMLAALIDIYDDAQNNAPEHRCYVESAWGECLSEARSFLAAPASAPEPSPLLMQDENSGRDGRRYNEWHASRPDARLNAREAADAAREVSAEEDAALRQAASAKVIARGRLVEAPEQQREYPPLPEDLLFNTATNVAYFRADQMHAYVDADRAALAQAAPATGKVGAVADEKACRYCGCGQDGYHPHLPLCPSGGGGGFLDRMWIKPPDEVFASSLLDKAKLLEKHLVIDRQNAEFPHTRRAAGIAAVLAHQLHAALKATPAPTVQAETGEAPEPTLADAIEHFSTSEAYRVAVERKTRIAALETHLDILEAENLELRAARAQSLQVDGASLSIYEQRAVLADLMGLECLINYHDCQEAGADAVEPGCGAGNARRALELLGIGREIIASDPELWHGEQKKAFALRHSELASLTAAQPDQGGAHG